MKEKCCGNCIYLFDDSTLTVCILKDWMNMGFYDDPCENYNDGGEYVGI